MDPLILEKIRDDIAEIKTSQLSTEKDLAIHISRTEAAEKRLDVLERLAEEIRTLLPQVKNVLKWWPIVSGLIVVMVFSKPELLTQVLGFLTKP